MKDIVVYTTTACSFCRRVKELLEARSIPYREVELRREDPDSRDELWARTGMMSFPQVVIDGELLGGFRELLTADRSGRLDELLAA